MGHCWCIRPRRAQVHPYLGRHASKAAKENSFRSRTRENGHFTQKWIIPSYIYNGKRYPNYLSGAGYVLSRPTANCLFEKAMKISYFPLEDAYTTGFAAEACGIQPLDNPGFILNDKGKFDRKKDILLHYFKPGFMNREKSKFAEMLDDS